MTARTTSAGGLRRMVAVSAGALIVSACGSDEPGGIVEPPASAAELEVISPAFADGEPIPIEHSCDGADEPPELSWSGSPGDTASHVVIVDDPDAPGGTFTHWLVVDLPADVRRLEGAAPAGAVVGQNDVGSNDWRGPCPPPDDDAHRYRFTVLALNTELGLEPGFDADQLAVSVSDRVLAQGTLTGTFDR